MMCERLHKNSLFCLTAALQMDEAVGLVNTLQNWDVIDKVILSTKTPEKKKIFGKGNFQTLTGMSFCRIEHMVYFRHVDIFSTLACCC